MIRNATRDDYDAISALIFNGSEPVGSACLLWSNNKKHLYCVTAYHCTEDDGMNYDVHIKQKRNGVIKDHRIEGERMADSANDIAIYELEYDDDL